MYLCNQIQENIKKMKPFTKNIFTFLTLAVFVLTAQSGLSATTAQKANAIPTSANHPFTMENGTLNGSRASFKDDHHIDWMNNGDYATYQLDNTVDAQYYTVTFTAGTTQPSVTLNFSIKDASGASVCNQDVSIENNGDWDSRARSYNFRTQEMLKGSYTMVITFKSVGGNGTTANVNDISFEAKEKFVSETVDNESLTISFPMDRGTEGQTATFGPKAEATGWFKTNYVSHGDGLTIVGSAQSQTQFQPSISNEGSANEGNAVDFIVIPKKGLKFTPTAISFQTTRFGTDGGKVDVSWLNADGTVTSLDKGIVPARNNATPNVTEYSKQLSDMAAADGLCGLRLNIYSLGNKKQVGFGSVVIEGMLSGTTEDVRQCKLVVNATPATAGKVTVTPNADTFDEGDEVTVSTTENFGYHFAGWQDGNGNVVSTANPYTFTMEDNVELTATFSQKQTFELKLTLTDGAQPNLVGIEPAGTFVGSRRMYEEGTEVKLTAQNNKILTFIGWENQSTDAERIVKMDGDQELTANFSATDYIVGWDFYNDQPGQERVADYKSDTENAGLLSLHNASGSTIGWLTRGIGNGQENGRYAARIWKNRSEGYYFEISFSSLGYTGLKVSSALGVGYNTYTVNNVEYSTDGKDYTQIGTFNLTASGWFDKEFSLPAAADNQPLVYIRWMPDRTSKLVGNETDYDGLAITDIFVTADASAQADEQAVLVSSNPAEGNTGVSSNGSIILTFDKKIVAGTGVATLGGEQLTPIISGKTAVFQYTGLEYATDYTFHMPEGVLMSRSGKPVAAATINFTTMERRQPDARLFDVIVAKDGSGDFTTVQKAVDAAPANRARPYLIFIKNGQYKEHINIPQNKPYLHFIGQDRDKTVILNDALSGGDNSVGTDAGATVTVKANNTFFENLTMENEYGHTKRNGPQALALNTQGDRIALNHVRLLSYQDTWITTSTSNYRHYIRHSIIEGAVDFIYNSGNVYMDGDTLEINRSSGGYIVAPSHGADVKWGYVFMNNVIRPVQGMTVSDIWLGRPWHNSPKTVFINTQLFVGVPATGWYETMGGLPVLWADYNTIDSKGNPVDLSRRRDTYYYMDGSKKVTGKAKNYLTDEEAAQYTVKNVMGGTDNWQPTLLCEACDAPVVSQNGSQLTWQPVPYAICYVVTNPAGEVAGFTTDCSFEATESTGWRVQAVNEYGGLSTKAAPGDATAILDSTQGLSDGSASTVQRPSFYTLGGTRTATLHKGLNIVRQSDGTVKKVLR